jgi:hypothetical protein
VINDRYAFLEKWAEGCAICGAILLDDEQMLCSNCLSVMSRRDMERVLERFMDSICDTGLFLKFQEKNGAIKYYIKDDAPQKELDALFLRATSIAHRTGQWLMRDILNKWRANATPCSPQVNNPS